MHTQHFFFRSPIFLKSRAHFYCDVTLEVAASVVQPSILLSHLLGDRALPVACHMRSCLARIGTEQVPANRNQLAVRQEQSCHRNQPLATLTLCTVPPIRTSAAWCLSGSQSGTKGQNSFILIVCPAQTILSRSSTSQCPSALFNLTAAVAPRCTVFAHE